MNTIEHFSTTEPVLLSEVIHDRLNINYEAFKKLLAFGAIYVNNQRQVKDRWILQNSEFRVHTQPRRYRCDHDWKSLIVFENESCIVLNKPAGIPSHPQIDNAVEDAMTQTSVALKTPLHVTHRLDTLTSGLIVYAKSRAFVKDFNVQLIHRTIEKKYVALVEGLHTFPKTLKHYMDPAKGTPKKLSAAKVDGWDECALEIIQQKVVSAERTWIKINLLTGRTHQIRSQMSFIGAPILGDKTYGSRYPDTENAIALKSCEIAFECSGERLQLRLDDSIPAFGL